MPNKKYVCWAKRKWLKAHDLDDCPWRCRRPTRTCSPASRRTPVLELGGTPVRRERGGRDYWYSVQRLADHTVERYLGPDTEEVRARVERARKVNEDLRQREKQRGRLARMCREGGLPRVNAQTGKVLLGLSKAGIFRLRGVIVGTHAFRCYPGLLGVEVSEARAVTEGIDFAAFHSVSVALDDRLDPALAEKIRTRILSSAACVRGRILHDRLKDRRRPGAKKTKTPPKRGPCGCRIWNP